MKTGDNSNGQLLSFIERTERLNAEIKELSDDKKDLMKEASSAGFDPKAIRVIIKRRAMDASKLAEHEAIVETYMASLGMI